MRCPMGRISLPIALIVLASMAAPAGATIVPFTDQDSWDAICLTIEGAQFLDLALPETYFNPRGDSVAGDVDPDQLFTPARFEAVVDASPASGAPDGSASQEMPGAATVLLSVSGTVLLLMARCFARGRNWAAGRTAAATLRLPAVRAAKVAAVRQYWYRENGLLYATSVSIRVRRRD